MNVKFNYLYRDGANYKQFHSEVFSNAQSLSIEEIEKSIRSALIEENWFYAKKWNLKDLHVYQWDNEIDHEWHEYENAEPTDEEATKTDIADFIKLIRNKD